MDNQLCIFDDEAEESVSEFAVQIIPEAPLYQEIEGYKKRFLNDFGTAKYIKTKPHISVVSFPTRTIIADKVVASIRGILETTSPLSLQTKEFTSYQNKRNNTYGLVVSVEAAPEVEQLQKDILNYCIHQLRLKKGSVSTTPSLHLTIGTEIPEEIISKALGVFQEGFVETNWRSKEIRLLKRDNTKGPWENFWDIKLNG